MMLLTCSFSARTVTRFDPTEASHGAEEADDSVEYYCL